MMNNLDFEQMEEDFEHENQYSEEEIAKSYEYMQFPEKGEHYLIKTVEVSLLRILHPMNKFKKELNRIKNEENNSSD